MYSNMVLLTVVTTSNPHTLYFDHPIEKPNYIRLLSASLYNSWNNLKKTGRITVHDKNDNPRSYLFFPGFYTLETLAYFFENVFKNHYGITLPTKIHQPTGSMIIINITGKKVLLDEDLADLLGYGRELIPLSFIERLKGPTTYFVHCDLIDKKQNLLNGKPSTVLARFDVRGKPFEKVHYQTPQPHVLRETDSGDYDVNSITLSVKDENGNLFDFKDHPLEFELEIN